MTASPSPAHGARRGRVRDAFARVFGVDLRSLALLRVGLALLLLADLALRAPFLAENQTDAGLVPRSVVWEHNVRSPLEIHALSGSYGLQAALFAVAVACAGLLLVGWRTRWATLASWLLLTSLHFRQPYLLSGAEHMLRLVLFWGVFLPLGARFSLDARRAPSRAPRRDAYFAPAGVALLLQVALIYFFSGLAKTGSQWRSSGTAIHWVLVDEQWVWPLAEVVAQLPREVLRLLTFSVLWLELLGPFLLFSPIRTGPVRTLVTAAFFALHCGIALTMKLGLFPFVNMAALLALLPGWVWERLPRSPRPGAAPRSRLVLARDACVSLVLLWVLLLNVSHHLPQLRMPEPLLRAGRALHLYQRWAMYGPRPRRHDLRFEILGTTRGGQYVQLSDPGHGPGWRAVRAIWENFHFRSSLGMLRHTEVSDTLSHSYASWVCRRWNEDAPPARALAMVELIAVIRPLSLNGEPGEERPERVVRHPCGGPGPPQTGQ